VSESPLVQGRAIVESTRRSNKAKGCGRAGGRSKLALLRRPMHRGESENEEWELEDESDRSGEAWKAREEKRWRRDGA
jgi:hypothetical protein